MIDLGMDSAELFSDRFGYQPPDAVITIREDAPDVVRDAVTMLGYACGLNPSRMRDAVCEVLLKRPDPNNWSAENIEREVSQLVDAAPWHRVYDIAERLYRKVGEGGYDLTRAAEFEHRLNAVFREHGVGWRMAEGVIVARGSEPFELATRDAANIMRNAGAPTAANELHEALKDISRRPDADVTGAVQHAMAALECVAREVNGTNETLGKIIGRLSVPPPLDGALHKLWGFTSTQGRHILEGRAPRFEEAELVVTVAASVSIYLLRAAGLADDV